MKKKLIISMLVLSACGSVFAQQQVSFTQYMFNGMSINPGYIGSHDALSISALGRWQWLGMEGAPRTQSLAVHSPIPNRNMGLGLQFTRDEIAVTNMTSVLAGYAYRIPVGSGILSMGVQGGMQSYQTSYSDVYTIGQDPTFQENTATHMPNFGAGLFYYNPVWYAGLSAPLLVNNEIKSGGNNLYTQRRHYFLTTGVALRASENVLVKPNLLVKMVEGSPVSLDYNVNVLLHEILWLGMSVRPPESISFLLEVNVNQRLRVGYAYDHIIDETISNVSGSSHEILLNYRIEWLKSKVVTPRYF